jgi:hypothetical protein
MLRLLVPPVADAGTDSMALSISRLGSRVFNTVALTRAARIDQRMPGLGAYGDRPEAPDIVSNLLQVTPQESQLARYAPRTRWLNHPFAPLVRRRCINSIRGSSKLGEHPP